MAISRRDRVLGGIWGVLVGDAGGTPYEMKKPSELPEAAFFDDWDPFVVPPTPYRRSHSAQPPNVYSDDGSQTLCLLASLLHCNAFDAQDFGERLVRWLDHGYLAANGASFGSGGTTRDALARIRTGTPAAKAGLGAECNLGNGALMRALPMALWYPPADESHYPYIVAAAMAQGAVTHTHPRSQVCVAAYTLWAYNQVNNPSKPFNYVDALEFVAEIADNKANLAYRVEALKLLRDLETNRLTPAGGFHVVDTFISAIEACKTYTFENVLRRSIRYGNDTDTTAAVACGLAGVHYGFDAIPERWVAAVKKTLVPEALDLIIQLEKRNDSFIVA